MSTWKNKAETRHERILQLLGNGDSVTIHTFCETLGCSESTIRNDLNFLEKEGKLRRVFGGAVKTEPTPFDFVQLSKREAIFTEEKQKISRYVIDHVLKPNQTIILDAGTTTSEIAKRIAEQNMPLTVLTDSLTVSYILSTASQVKLYLFGGFYYPDRAFYYDSVLQPNIDSMRADIFFLAVNGVSPEGVFTITGQDETSIKGSFINISAQTIAVVDHSKINRTGLKIVPNGDKVKRLITDDQADPEYLDQMRTYGMQVEIASTL